MTSGQHCFSAGLSNWRVHGVKMRVFCVMRRLGGLDTNSQPGAKTETSVLSTDKTFTSAFSSIQHQDDACLGAEVGKFAFLQCTRN